jgi:TPR repeat protein
MDRIKPTDAGSAPGGNSRRAVLGVLGLGLLAFVVLALRFSPDWLTFRDNWKEAKAGLTQPGEWASIDEAILSGYATRGGFVLRQARDLGTEIDDPNHKIVRWRLLVPVVGRVLHLPDVAVLGLAQVGCAVLIWAVVAWGATALPGRSKTEALALGLVVGASSPFFASMGWLGYYDSWLALGLLVVAFAPARSVVLAACVLTPWVDERFVIGLPLALCVRSLRPGDLATADIAWLRREALWPLLLAAGYVAVRLQLGGSGGSQTVGEYLGRFVFGETISAAQRIHGAWAGLRAGWLPVAAALVAAALAARRTGSRRGALLLAGVGLTGGVGLFTALDLSRSMVLLLPVVPLGWLALSRLEPWRRWHLGPVLAVTALVLPARHVFGRVSIPVDNWFVPSEPLVCAQNNVAVRYASGNGVPMDLPRALAWYRRSAEAGYMVAQSNLGGMLLKGVGGPRQPEEGVRWLRRAAERGYDQAQSNLGLVYAKGDGVPRDPAASARWYQLAAIQGFAPAQFCFAVALAEGDGVGKDRAEAAKWYRRAAAQGHAGAQNNLGVLYATGDGVPVDRTESARWYRLAAEQGLAAPQNNLALMYANGDGVPLDKAEAVRWLRRSAAQGYATAQFNLGVYLAAGEGVTKDPVQARAWLGLSLANGHQAATGIITLLDRELTPDQIAAAAELAKGLAVRPRAP